MLDLVDLTFLHTLVNFFSFRKDRYCSSIFFINWNIQYGCNIPQLEDLLQDKDNLHQRSRLGVRGIYVDLVGFLLLIYVVFSFSDDIDSWYLSDLFFWLVIYLGKNLGSFNLYESPYSIVSVVILQFLNKLQSLIIKKRNILSDSPWFLIDTIVKYHNLNTSVA